MSLLNRLSSVWNAFVQKDRMDKDWVDRGTTTTYRPDTYTHGGITKARGLITPIYNRIAMDVADIPIKHVRVDPYDERYLGDINDDINDRLNLSANLDQTGRAFIQDATFSMFDEGVIALAPIDTDDDPKNKGGVKIYSIRCGRITQWAPKQVQIYLYDERNGQSENVWFDKESVAIIQNPFFEVMNAPNSVMQRLLHKMALLDKIDNESATGKLDLIIQLPYTVKSQKRLEQARMRRNEIISQLTEEKYGIAYTDGTEKITQLNRPIENSLPQQIDSLWTQLYNNLYMTPDILNGTANEAVMTNYYARVISPCLDAFIDEMNRKFLTKTARSQGQRFKYFRDYFKLVPLSDMADLADKLTRNEILSSNEIRQIIGFTPVDTPEAEELRNKNLNRTDNDPAILYGPENQVPVQSEQPPINDGYTDDDYGFH